MKNKDVIDKFLNKEAASGSHLYSDGFRLVNYYTTLAEWFSECILFVNDTKYSVSTSKNQSWLKQAIDKHDNLTPITLKNISIGTKDLTSIYEKSLRGI